LVDGNSRGDVFNIRKILYSAVIFAKLLKGSRNLVQARYKKLAAAGIIVTVVFAVVMTIIRTERSRDLVLQIEPIDPSNDVTVYVGGAVEESGLISLARGSRVAEAVELAGIRDDADTSSLSMAAPVQDGQTITVPRQIATSDGATESSESMQGSASDPPGEDVVNINVARAVELQELPGIGPAIADRIIEYRDIEGPFQNVDELSGVSGISDRMVDEIREHITTDH
jgi:competence protein ComEA